MAPPAKGDGPERWLAEGFAKLTEDGGVVKRVDEAGEEAEVSSRLEKGGGVKEREQAKSRAGCAGDVADTGAGACAHCSPPAVRARAKYEDDDETPPSGAMVSVHYTGTFPDSGEVFDSSLSRGAPLQFEVGAGRVVAGFDAAVRSMMKCEKATFVLQPEYGYGKNGVSGASCGASLYRGKSVSVQGPSLLRALSAAVGR